MKTLFFLLLFILAPRKKNKSAHKNTKRRITIITKKRHKRNNQIEQQRNRQQGNEKKKRATKIQCQKVKGKFIHQKRHFVSPTQPNKTTKLPTTKKVQTDANKQIERTYHLEIESKKIEEE